jgi:asparagine synthetase B (glutamine-hydrolysing)
VHNGIVPNDDELLARYGIARAEPQMTVDSEAIFALMEVREHDPRALSELRGAMAAAWLDDRDNVALYLARGRLRPLWVALAPGGFYFASTRRALTIVAAALRVRLDIHGVREGRMLEVHAGQVVRRRRFRPDRRYQEEGTLPPVRAPREAVSCLERFAALASGSAA